MAPNIFSILKTECIYRCKPKTFQEVNDLIDRYIYFYNHERIQNKTGVASLTLRHSAQTEYFLHRRFLGCPYKLGQFKYGAAFVTAGKCPLRFLEKGCDLLRASFNHRRRSNSALAGRVVFLSVYTPQQK